MPPLLEAQLDHMQPEVIVTLGNFATRFILEEKIGITKARGHMYERMGAAVIPTFHPAAALRGGKFGGISPIDAIRQDLRSAGSAGCSARRSLPDGDPSAVRRRCAVTVPGAPPLGPLSEDPAEQEQLGLF